MQLPALVESFENFSKMQNSSNHHLVHSFANDQCKYRHISKGNTLHSFFYSGNLGGLYLTEMCIMMHVYEKLSKLVSTFYKLEISAIEKKFSYF